MVSVFTQPKYLASSAPLMSAYGEGTGAIAFDGVDCAGNESSLVDCPADVDHNCTHAKDASVVCSGKVFLHAYFYHGSMT